MSGDKINDAVDAVTAALDNVTLPNKNAEDRAATDAASVSAAEGRRLYIGNLAYASTETELREFFKGYLVETVSIPKNPRTEKAVGYAFVDLSTPSEADRAIANLSGTEILERKVSVQLAHKPEPGETEGQANGDGHDEPPHRHSTRGRGGRGRGGRGGHRGSRGPRTPGTDGSHEGDGSCSKDAVGVQEAKADAFAAHGSTEAAPLADITNKNATDKGEKTSKTHPRPLRERRERGPPADGIASKTKVMVANLPYDLSEEKLKDLFEPYQASSAKIALRPIPRFMIKKLQARNEPRKGRGFGFVTLASEELQHQAVLEMNGKTIDGREIAVKVAIDSPDKIDGNDGEPVGEGAHAGAGHHDATHVNADAAPVTATA